MKHADEKVFWSAKVMKIMKLNDTTDAAFGVGASCELVSKIFSVLDLTTTALIATKAARLNFQAIKVEFLLKAA